MRIKSALIALCLLTPATALAAPKVASDIAPVHSLVSQVMKGLGEPSLILPPGASPHGYSMRPSEAAGLADADVIFWIGEDLAPWFGRAASNLAPNAVAVELLKVKGTELLQYREGASFEHDHGAHDDHDDHKDEHRHDDDKHDDHAKDKDHDHDDHAKHKDDDHDHDDHAGHKHDDHDHDDHAKAKDDHDHDAHGHDDHAHDGADPHAWLDPENAIVWLEAIADTLSKADPDNAATYHANADAGVADIRAAMADVKATLAPAKGKAFFVFHDAYHYFEHRFGFEASGAISIGDASAPSPARVKEVQDHLKETKAHCVFAEPQFEPKLIRVVIEGTDVKVGTLDPLGTDLSKGADFYPALLKDLAGNLAKCLSGGA